MENIALFIGTVFIYSIAWFLFNRVSDRWTKYAKQAALVALLVLPVNINGNVFTVAGNAVAEKNVFSIFSVYQRAGNDALSLVSIGYQNTRRDAKTAVGLAHQYAGRDAFTGIGLVYQNAGRDAKTAVGLAHQYAGRDAFTGIGLAIYQQAKRKVESLMAVALYQRVGEKTRTFGAFLPLTKD